jgi:hypothetical protein
MAAKPSPILKRTLVWLNYHTYVINQRENLHVGEQSHVKPISLKHLSKIGLRRRSKKS